MCVTGYGGLGFGPHSNLSSVFSVSVCHSPNCMLIRVDKPLHDFLCGIQMHFCEGERGYVFELSIMWFATVRLCSPQKVDLRHPSKQFDDDSMIGPNGPWRSTEIYRALTNPELKSATARSSVYLQLERRSQNIKGL